MEYVFICVLVMFFRMFWSSRGVCRFDVGCVWLCMHIIDIKDGFVCWLYLGHYGVGL